MITEVLASKVTVHSNKTFIGRAKYLILFGFCRIANADYYYQYADDFMIIELSEDVEYSLTLHPACVATDTSDNRAGSVLDFYGYGQNRKTLLFNASRSLNLDFQLSKTRKRSRKVRESCDSSRPK